MWFISSLDGPCFHTHPLYHGLLQNKIQPETTLLNKTIIPAQQTNVTINQTTVPGYLVSPQVLQPLENLTQSQSTANFSGIENKTMVTPTGNATTTILR